MNNDRRKALKTLAEQVRELSGTLADIKSALEELKGEEEEYKENMPESFKDGDKGQAADAAIDAMDSAVNGLDVDLDEVADFIDTAAE